MNRVLHEFLHELRNFLTEKTGVKEPIKGIVFDDKVWDQMSEEYLTLGCRTELKQTMRPPTKQIFTLIGVEIRRNKASDDSTDVSLI